MKNLFYTLFLFLLISYNSCTALANTVTNELPICVIKSHCVRVEWVVDDVDDSFKKVVDLISSTPRTKIVEKTDSYLHAEAQTKWRRYTDDLLVKALPDLGIIQIRSESRVGVGDMGVNQKRVDDLLFRISMNKTND